MKTLLFVSLSAFLAGCSASADTPPTPKKSRHEVIGHFQSKTYNISDHEHVVAFDIPDRFSLNRCWTYVNEMTKTSNMHCDSDEPGTDMPDEGPNLDR